MFRDLQLIMYPSNGYVNPTLTDHNDFNPNLEIQDLSSSSSSCLFHFPSPLNQYEDEAIYLQHFHAILSQNDLDSIGAANKMIVPEITANSSQNMKEVHVCAEGGSSDYQPPVAKKNMSKKDRHSKINTAHGPRDRRMRLSLDVARKFFGLQDMLKFDKASKTVEWLLKQSKMAIKELTGQFTQTNKGGSGMFTLCASTSDCEVVSGIDEYSVAETGSVKTVLPNSTCSTKKKRVRKVRKPAFYPIDKESRNKARERARERTNDKKMKQQLDDQQSTNLMTWSSPVGTDKEVAGCSHNTISYNSPPYSFDEVEEMQNACKQQMKSQGNIRDEGINISDPNLFVIAGNWSPSALFNYQHSSEISQEFADYQFYGYHNL